MAANGQPMASHRFAYQPVEEGVAAVKHKPTAVVDGFCGQCGEVAISNSSGTTDCFTKPEPQSIQSSQKVEGSNASNIIVKNGITKTEHLTIGCTTAESAKNGY